MKRITKRDIFIFLLGAILFGTTGVIAATLIASDITYDNTHSSLNANNVQDAIDELYTKASIHNYDEYNGTTTYTPNSNTQIIPTNNKFMNSDITINPIPSNYKDVNDATNFSSGDLKNGEKAYNSDGELITGTSKDISVYKFELYNDTRSNNESSSVFVFKTDFNRVKYTNLTKDSNTNNCYVRGWSRISSTYINYELNQTYNINDNNDEINFQTIEVVSTSKSNGTFSRCQVKAELFN